MLRQRSTVAELTLWRLLRNRQLEGCKFRRQHRIAGYVVDFCCAEAGLVVEVDGGQHARQAARDERRTRILESAGYRVIRYWNNEALENPEGVVEDIRSHLLSLAPRRRGEGRGEGFVQATTLGEAVQELAVRLAGAGIEAARLEARLLVAHALGIATTRILGWPETGIDEPGRQAIAALCGRRLRREPMAHILGSREFWGLPFRVTPAVLVPRPDTETVVEAVLAEFPDRSRPLRILDLGTGSGCLLLALLNEYPAAFGIGVDVSPGALAVAAANAADLALRDRAGLVAGDWDAPLGRRFDVVVSNPPYVRSGDIPGLEPEVARYDPLAALDGGADGLDAYRRIAAGLDRVLEPQGAAFLEVGQGQHAEVADLLERRGFATALRADLARTYRCVIARKAKIL